ncbi:SWIB/MDM2 domain-containing protein [Methylobacterium sp. D54C]
MAAATKAKAKAAPKADAKPAKAPTGLDALVTPSKALSDLVGTAPLKRTEAVSKLWEHIKAHNLQNPSNKREILADAKLKAALGQDKFTMFEMNSLLSKQLTK